MQTDPARLLMEQSTVPHEGWMRHALRLWWARKQGLEHLRLLWGYPPGTDMEALSRTFLCGIDFNQNGGSYATAQAHEEMTSGGAS